MPSPFPGMNPYLELPALWPEFHNRLIVALSDAIAPELQPKYYVNKQVSFMRLKVVLEPSDEGGYTIYVPSLPGCISEGEDVDDAMANIQEAIALYLEPSEDEIQPLPGLIVRELVI